MENLQHNLYKGSYMDFNLSIGDHRTVILEINNKLIYWENFEKVYPYNTHRLTGAHPEEADEYIWLMKEFEVKHDIISQI